MCSFSVRVHIVNAHVVVFSACVHIVNVYVLVFSARVHIVIVYVHIIRVYVHFHVFSANEYEQIVQAVFTLIGLPYKTWENRIGK